MSRGKAIIEARKILGNQGAIRRRGSDYCIGIDDGDFALKFSGRDWKEALSRAAKGKA